MIAVPRRAPTYVPGRRIVRPRIAGPRRSGLLLATSGPPAGALDPDETGATPYLWLSAHDDAPDPLSLNNNDPVVTWPDSGAGNRDYTQATSGHRPLFKTDVLGVGRNGVLFDGTDDHLQRTEAPNSIGMQAVAVVALSASPPAAHQYILSSLGSGGLHFNARRNATNNRVSIWDGGAWRESTFTLPTDGTPHVVSFAWNPSVAGGDTAERRYIRVDGDYYLDEAQGASTPSLTAWNIGAFDTGPASMLKGHLFEVASWNSTDNMVSDDDIAAVEDMFAFRWGL